MSSNPAQAIQHYVIKFVSDLQQVGGFLRVFWFPPPIKLTATTVWEMTARQLAKGEWKFRVASKIHFILAGLASRNLKTLATITGYSFKIS